MACSTNASLHHACGIGDANETSLLRHTAHSNHARHCHEVYYQWCCSQGGPLLCFVSLREETAGVSNHNQPMPIISETCERCDVMFRAS